MKVVSILEINGQSHQGEKLWPGGAVLKDADLSTRMEARALFKGWDAVLLHFPSLEATVIHGTTALMHKPERR